MTKIARVFAVLFCAGLNSLFGAAALAQTEITVVRGDESYPPFEMLVDGRLTGLHIDLVEAAARKLGVSVKWDSLPWKRALRMVEEGQADAVTYITRTPDREAWAIFQDGNVLSSSEVRFIVLKEQAGQITFDGNLARFLAQHRPIVVRGFAFGNVELDALKKLEGNNMQDVVRMLKAGHSDIAVVNWGDFVGAFKGKPELAQVAPLKPPILSLHNYIAFSRSKKDEDLALRFAAALSEYKNTAEYAALLRRYRLER
ncbi:substrate-binding periplasmic protein [Roseateles oligotrophus]|uniref:Transporter substrate-binding domain-containing protein n=1 Tax=Roseateles oligotrophus TaxID=1769250 RepID=A0ABT2YKK2_9BURK|nr:transporter substrate-binding domain-containing protein [Roseateles oligotrophus]MCV2370579.1 transporter substrate-binding domain-containing protein [Roseateles oligotrophus]